MIIKTKLEIKMKNKVNNNYIQYFNKKKLIKFQKLVHRFQFFHKEIQEVHFQS